MALATRFDWLFRPQMADEDMPLSAEARFAQALAELPAPERSALALSEIGGLDTAEIAERLGTDREVAAKLLERARSTVRVSLAERARRAATALFPFHGWLSSGGSAPAAKTVGLVAAAVVGTSVAIGGAAADTPRPALTSPDPPSAQTLPEPRRRAPAAVTVTAARPLAEMVVGDPTPAKSPADAPRRRPAESLPTSPDAPAPTAEPAQAVEPSAPPAARPAPPPAPAEEPVTTAARTASPELPVVPVQPPPVELPVQPPPVESVPVLPPMPETPSLPPLPAVPLP